MSLENPDRSTDGIPFLFKVVFLCFQVFRVPQAFQIDVNKNHVFGVFFSLSSTDIIFMEKHNSKTESTMPLSRTCATNTNDEAFLNNFERANLELKSTKTYRSPSVQPVIEESGQIGEF